MTQYYNFVSKLFADNTFGNNRSKMIQSIYINVVNLKVFGQCSQYRELRKNS